MTGSIPSSEVQHWMPVFVLITAGLLSSVLPFLGRLEHQAAVSVWGGDSSSAVALASTKMSVFIYRETAKHCLEPHASQELMTYAAGILNTLFCFD